MTHEEVAKAIISGGKDWLTGNELEGFEFHEKIFEYWAYNQRAPVLKACLKQFEEFFYNNTKSIHFLKNLIKEKELVIQN